MKRAGRGGTAYSEAYLHEDQTGVRWMTEGVVGEGSGDEAMLFPDGHLRRQR